MTEKLMKTIALRVTPKDYRAILKMRNAGESVSQTVRRILTYELSSPVSPSESPKP